MDTEFAVFIGFWTVILLELVWEEGFGVVEGSVGCYGSRVKADKGSVDNAFKSKGKHLVFHDVREDAVVEVFQEAVKRPIRRKRA